MLTTIYTNRRDLFLINSQSSLQLVLSTFRKVPEEGEPHFDCRDWLVKRKADMRGLGVSDGDSDIRLLVM